MQAIRQRKQVKGLRPIKGFKELDGKTVRLAETAWVIAYTGLWNGERITLREKDASISFIKSFLMDATEPKIGYDQFVQRVLLARIQMIEDNLFFVPTPSLWFDQNNMVGFASTNDLFRREQLERLFLPQYTSIIQMLGRAVLEVAETKSARIFHQWRSYFVEKDCQNTLNLFLAVVNNLR